LQHEKENDKDGRKFDIGPRLTEKEIKIILEIMIPINIVVLRMLMDKLLKKEHFSSVADRVVVVFVGETGVGKSTLILYLLGY
jgi:putative ribosome biogenesis GTPase RsgA